MNQYLERASLTWSEDSIRLINTPTQLAKSSFFYMQEAGYFKTMPPYFTERENLNSFLILYTISGQGVLQYQSKEYTLSAGQCFFIHCKNHHLYYALKGPQWEFLWLHFYGSSSLGYYQEFERNGFRIRPLADYRRPSGKDCHQRACYFPLNPESAHKAAYPEFYRPSILS